MAYNIQALKTDLEGVLHGTTANQITGINNLINRAARTLLLDLDPQETKRTLEFAAPIFSGVADYAIAPDVKGNRLIDIRPQVNRLPRDTWSQAYNQAFDVARQNAFSLSNMFTMSFSTGLKSIRINAPFLPPPVVVSYADTVSGNGTWSAGGGASSLGVDSQNFAAGAGALSFNLPNGTGYVENSTIPALNLQAMLNQGSFFAYVYMPTASQFTSVELRWGSSASNYWAVTATQTQQGTAFQNGWNLLQFRWLGASSVGTPNSQAVSYLRVTYSTTAFQTAAKLNYVTVSLGNVLEYEYYSKYLFRDAATGSFQETVTDDSNLINLDTESYNLLFSLVASLAAQQQQGLDAIFYDGSFFAQQYQTGLARYRALYKSEAQKPQTSFYAMPRKGYGRWIGRGWN